MKTRMKLTASLMIVTLSMGLLVGCGLGGRSQSKSGITIDESLGIEAVIVKPFDENLYDVTELKAMMDEEAASYNSMNGEGRVVAGTAEVTEGNVCAVMSYQSAEDYAAFNTRMLRIKLLSDAVNSGEISVALRNVNEDTVVNPSNIEDTAGLYLVTSDEVGDVTCPGKVLYVSDGVEVENKKKVSITDDMDGLAYIVFKLN